jgi:mRNA interferase MazF
VPFPFVDRPRLRPRPALLVSDRPVGPGASLGWVLMITSSANSGWPGDILLEDRYAECGLPVPCVIRTAKIATIALASAKPMGRLPDDLMAVVRAEICPLLGP